MIATTDENDDRVVTVGGSTIKINQKGYLINFDEWTEEFAREVAKNEQLQLINCHWEVIRFLRDFYREYEVPPSPYVIKKAIGEKIGLWGCTNKDLKKAFPKGGCKQACRIAGLPDHYCHSC